MKKWTNYIFTWNWPKYSYRRQWLFPSLWLQSRVSALLDFTTLFFFISYLWKQKNTKHYVFTFRCSSSTLSSAGAPARVCVRVGGGGEGVIRGGVRAHRCKVWDDRKKERAGSLSAQLPSPQPPTASGQRKRQPEKAWKRPLRKRGLSQLKATYIDPHQEVWYRGFSWRDNVTSIATTTL